MVQYTCVAPISSHIPILALLAQTRHNLLLVSASLIPVAVAPLPLGTQAMEMKAEGKYVARGLSFRDAEFHEVQALLTPQQVGALLTGPLCGWAGEWAYTWCMFQRRQLEGSVQPGVVVMSGGWLASGKALLETPTDRLECKSSMEAVMRDTNACTD